MLIKNMLEYGGGGCLVCFKLSFLHAHTFLAGNNTSSPTPLKSYGAYLQ